MENKDLKAKYDEMHKRGATAEYDRRAVREALHMLGADVTLKYQVSPK